MNKTKTDNVIYTVTAGTRVDFAVMGDASTRYEREYFQVDVYVDNKRYIGGFVNDPTDEVAINEIVNTIVEWASYQRTTATAIGSRFD